MANRPLRIYRPAIAAAAVAFAGLDFGCGRGYSSVEDRECIGIDLAMESAVAAAGMPQLPRSTSSNPKIEFGPSRFAIAARVLWVE